MMRRDALKGAVVGLFMGGANKNGDVFHFDHVSAAKPFVTQLMPSALRTGIGAVDIALETIYRFKPIQNQFVNISYVTMDVNYIYTDNTWKTE